MGLGGLGISVSSPPFLLEFLSLRETRVAWVYSDATPTRRIKEMSDIQDKISQPRMAGFGMGYTLSENTYKVKGQVLGVLTHADGTTEEVLNKNNIYTLDGGILAAMLFAGEAGVGGVSMLAVGTGATGLANAPDIADNRQRKLNVEVARKAFSSVVYRAADGSVSAVPTNVLDLTTVFTETEASGAGLTEMGLLSPISAVTSVTNPPPDVFPSRDLTADMRSYDVLVNYLTFPVIHKLQGSVLALTWRLTF